MSQLKSRKSKSQKIRDVRCDYCGEKTVLVSGNDIYRGRPDLAHLKFWMCWPCDAYVGTHANSQRNVPLGRLANKELRQLRVMTHAAFDPIWRRHAAATGTMAGKARQIAYAMLAARLGIRKRDCHIGRFDNDLCLRAIEICREGSSVAV